MVTSDSRNNLIIVIVILATAIISSLLINGFISKMEQVSNHGEKTMNLIGNKTSQSLDQLVTNVTNATAKSSNNAKLITGSMNNMSHSVNNSILNLNKTVKIFRDQNIEGINNMTGTLNQLKDIFIAQIKEQHKVNLWLANISKQLDMVPVTPIPQPPGNNCSVQTPNVCILPHGAGIIVNHK